MSGNNAPRWLEIGLSACMIAFISATNAHGAVAVTALEAGDDVVFTGSGTLNIEGGIFMFQIFGGGGSIRAGGSPVGFQVGPPPFLPVDGYIFGDISGPTSIGPAREIRATSGSGDIFGLDYLGPMSPFGSKLLVPVGYSSGTSLSGTSTYTGETFSSLGLNRGVYIWSWGSGTSADSLTLNIVPEPSSALMLLTGIVSACLARIKSNQLKSAPGILQVPSR